MRLLKSAVTKFLLSIILGLSFFSLSCGNSVAELAGTDAALGRKAPGFTLNDLSGRSVSLADFYGKKSVLLICTTTWCPHCVTIIPELKDIYNEYHSNGLEMIAIYINESQNKVSSFSQKHTIPYTVLLDLDGAAASAYRIRGVPTLVLIDKNGIIQYRGNSVPMNMIDQVI